MTHQSTLTRTDVLPKTNTARAKPLGNYTITTFLSCKPMFKSALLVLGRVDDDTTGRAFGKTEPKRTIPQVQELKILLYLRDDDISCNNRNLGGSNGF